MTQYNILYLSGQRDVTDEVYKQIILEDYGVEIPEESLHTLQVNDFYLTQNPVDNAVFLKKKLAENGLLDMENTNG